MISGTGVLRPLKPTDEDNDKQEDILKKLMEEQQAQGIQAQGTMDDAIYIYKNGFKIGNNPFQPDNTSENKKFLEELKQGALPKQLLPTLKEKFGPNANSMRVKIIDKQDEEYEEQPVEKTNTKFEAFQGQGHSLNTSDDNNNKNNNSNNDLYEKVESKEIHIDKKEETTKVQVIFYNGKRETLIVNLNHTILELYAHIKFISGYDGKFQLLAGFPPKPLENSSQTIRDAQLQGARITQKTL